VNPTTGRGPQRSSTEWIRSPRSIVVLGFFGNYCLTTAYAADQVIHGNGPSQVLISGVSGRSGSQSELFFLTSR
jgi:hypothetical protein